MTLKYFKSLITNDCLANKYTKCNMYIFFFCSIVLSWPSLRPWLEISQFPFLKWNIIHFLKRREILPFATTWMDLWEGHYTKWNKPDTEKQIQYDFTYLRNLKKKKINSQNQRIEWYLPGFWRLGKWGRYWSKSTNFKLYNE